MSEEVAEAPAADLVDQANGQASVDWKASIPEEIRGHKSLETIQDVPSLAKSYVNAQSMIGADKIALPGKSSTPEQWSEIYSKLGRPEAADKYELSNKLPEGQEVNEQLMGGFTNTAHAAGLNTKQAQSLLDWYNNVLVDNTAQVTAAEQAQLEEKTNELKQHYGPAFDDRVKLARAVSAQFTEGDESLHEVKLADGSLLGNHPDFIKMVSNMGVFMKEKMGEDKLEGVKTSGAATKHELEGKIAELSAPDTPYWDSKHPQHDWYVNEVTRINGELYPDE
ncbi:MAG: hypothetical protein CMB77_02415 [Euryarchaeota archaeon]|nr:hypothetical protein [Euryarchaeota archaeon]|tara:strand:- start:9666 stop:10505 length:840 start_codon:yes stop_codon:yes gene_type:complete